MAFTEVGAGWDGACRSGSDITCEEHWEGELMSDGMAGAVGRISVLG